MLSASLTINFHHIFAVNWLIFLAQGYPFVTPQGVLYVLKPRLVARENDHGNTYRPNDNRVFKSARVLRNYRKCFGSAR
jgi:hypothetical protein